MMEKSFEVADVEKRVAARWDEAGAFRAGRLQRRNAKPYCVVIPPPNVTGNLHMGHALNNTLQDILCRYHRMNGEDVLWQPGTDHAGIATQMVVERQLAERQQADRRTLGRAAFLERVWEWKAESGGAIVGQLKRLGASCDWSRERFTLDEGLSKAVAKVFVQLHRDGLIYKAKRLVNWDPKFQTAISDLEVVQVDCKGSFKWSRDDGAPLDEAALTKALGRNPNGHLYYFDYPAVDANGEESGAVVTVATTRPETMLGDSAVAVHPDDERFKRLVGSNVRLPLVGRLMRIVADAYSDPEKGTGAVKITPAHDFNDFDVGRRHEAEGARQINILDAEARICLKGNLDFFAHHRRSPPKVHLRLLAGQRLHPPERKRRGSPQPLKKAFNRGVTVREAPFNDQVLPDALPGKTLPQLGPDFVAVGIARAFRAGIPCLQARPGWPVLIGPLLRAGGRVTAGFGSNCPRAGGRVAGRFCNLSPDVSGHRPTVNPQRPGDPAKRPALCVQRHNRLRNRHFDPVGHRHPPFAEDATSLPAPSSKWPVFT